MTQTLIRTALPSRSRVTTGLLAAALATSLMACGPTTLASESPPAETAAAASPTTPTASASVGSLGEIPEGARVSDGGSDPRSAAYWVAWSTCGAGSQAEVARQNGGRAAGWILVDDLLSDPGLALGDRVIRSCEEAVEILIGSNESTLPRGVAGLVPHLLVAELNLSSGAESCSAVEGSVPIAQALLSAMGFDGQATRRDPNDGETVLVMDVAAVLADYNAGALCR